MEINDKVRVTLTKYGAKVLNKTYGEFNKKFGPMHWKDDYKEGDVMNGQMWYILREFSFEHGEDIPFTNMQKIEEEKEMSIDDVYSCILSITKWNDIEIKERGSGRKSSEKRAIIACILSDFKFIQDDIARIINRDRSCIVHYQKNIREYVKADIIKIKMGLCVRMNGKKIVKGGIIASSTPMG